MVFVPLQVTLCYRDITQSSEEGGKEKWRRKKRDVEKKRGGICHLNKERSEGGGMD